MGQLVSVTASPSPQPGLVRFEANRSLTGMGHETFHSAADAVGPRPAASLARMIFATGKADAVHMYGNIVTVDLGKGQTADGLAEVMRDMYQYWKPGMEPAVFEAPAADEPAAAAAAPAAGGASGPEAAYLAAVPANLVERSRAALAKWKANH